MQRLVAFTLQGIGNTLLSTPVIVALQKHFRVTACVIGNDNADVVRAICPGVDVYVYKSSLGILTQSTGQADVAVALYPSWRRELTALARTPSHRKFLIRDPDFLLSSIFPAGKVDRRQIHDLENNFALVEEITGSADFPWGLGMRPLPMRHAVALHPTASTPTKYYPVQFWREITSYCRSKGFEIEMFCGPANVERDYCANILRGFPENCNISLHVGNQISDVIDRVRSATQFIGSDSSLMHLAALFDVPTIGLWSYADYRRIYPYAKDAQVFLPEEAVNRVRFTKATRNIAALLRAKVNDLIDILEEKRPCTFEIVSRFKGPVRFYSF